MGLKLNIGKKNAPKEEVAVTGSMDVSVGGTEALDVSAPAEDGSTQAPTNPPPQAATGFKKPSWMKSGADADEVFEQQAEAKATFGGALEKRKALPWEFWMKPGAEHRITFLDGTLSTDPAEEGRLLYNAFRFHSVRNTKFASQWDNYVCIAEEGVECPLCALGDDPSWVGVFPVVDHTPYKKTDGTVIQHRLKLYIAKPITIKLLQKKAQKFGGLAYKTFDVSRTDKKMARVGDQMEFVNEVPVESFHSKLPEIPVITPEWYMSAVPYFTAEEILSMGYGAGTQQTPGEGANVGAGALPGPVGADLPEGDDLPF